MTSLHIPNPDLDTTGAASRPTSAPTTVPGAEHAERLFAWLRRQPIRRNSADRWFGGVCSSVAEYLGVSVNVTRIVTAALTLLAGTGVAAYLFAWLLLPNRDGRILAEEALRTGRGAPVALLAVTAFVLLTGFLGLPVLLAAIAALVGAYLLEKHASVGHRRAS